MIEQRKDSGVRTEFPMVGLLLLYTAQKSYVARLHDCRLVANHFHLPSAT
jgi:hypothetical protein